MAESILDMEFSQNDGRGIFYAGKEMHLHFPLQEVDNFDELFQFFRRRAIFHVGLILRVGMDSANIRHHGFLFFGATGWRLPPRSHLHRTCRSSKFYFRFVAFSGKALFIVAFIRFLGVVSSPTFCRPPESCQKNPH